jgi:hypothetical protein
VFRFQALKREIPILKISERGFEEQRFFCPMDNGVPSLEVKLAELEIKHLTLSRTKDKNEWNYTSLWR